MQRSSRLQCKGSTFLSQLLHFSDPEYWSCPGNRTSRSAVNKTKLILPAEDDTELKPFGSQQSFHTKKKLMLEPRTVSRLIRLETDGIPHPAEKKKKIKKKAIDIISLKFDVLT